MAVFPSRKFFPGRLPKAPFVYSIALIFLLSKAAFGASSVEFVWSGAVTHQSATVKTKLMQEGGIARLTVSEMPDLSSPFFSNWDTAVTAENNRVVAFALNGLAPNRQYYYAMEVGGILDTEKVGRFQTFPQDTGSFTFAFGSCALTASNHAVFQTIRSQNPLFFFHLGDFHYQNISVNDRNLFRQAFDAVLSTPNQSRLYRDVPIAYIWDDHDYGPNNSDSTAPGRLAARLTYQEYVPHYPLAAGSGDIPIYYTFDVGRVHFIVCDSRSARSSEFAPDNVSKTMLGTTQKAWFKQELLNSKSSYALIVWVNTLPWIGTTGGDAWMVYTNERRELADFIKVNGIQNLCMISGDAHMIAIDNGINNNFTTGGGPGFPVMHGAALDQVGSLKGGPYSHGAFPGGGQFALMTVIDTPESLRVEWSGRNHLNQELVGHSFRRAFFLDFDGDGQATPADVVILLNVVFLGSIPPFNAGGTDINRDGSSDPADVVALLNYTFLGIAP